MKHFIIITAIFIIPIITIRFTVLIESIFDLTHDNNLNLIDRMEPQSLSTKEPEGLSWDKQGHPSNASTQKTRKQSKE